MASHIPSLLDVNSQIPSPFLYHPWSDKHGAL